MECIKEAINPFDANLDQCKLFNLSTGRAASQETTDFLLSVRENGHEKLASFSEACKEDMSYFEKPITKNKPKTFANELYQHTKSSKGKQITEIKIERNIVCQMLDTALQNELDLNTVFSFPLTMTPHSLAHYDGTIHSYANKGDLIQILQAKVNEPTTSPTDIKIEIIDGLDFLRSLIEYPYLYGRMANFVLEKLCQTSASEIYIIFDKYENPSIRDPYMRNQVSSYNQDSYIYKINGQNQERTASFPKLLNNPSFQEEFVKFLLKHWNEEENDISLILGNKRVFVLSGKDCHVFSQGFERNEQISHLENNHIEVETRMIMILNKTADGNNILIRSQNIEAILVYMLYHQQFMTHSRNIWIQNFKHSRKPSDVINVEQIYSKLSSDMINALPAWYIFSGYLYEPCFFNRSKKRHFNVLEKNVELQQAFGEIGLGLDVTQQHMQHLEKFTCLVYNSKKNSVNEARAEKFRNVYKSQNELDFNNKGISISPQILIKFISIILISSLFKILLLKYFLFSHAKKAIEIRIKLYKITN